jgi:hypothetical protein
MGLGAGGSMEGVEVYPKKITFSECVVPFVVPRNGQSLCGEMLFFMDQVQDWAMDHGVTLTCPADSEYMKLKGG